MKDDLMGDASTRKDEGLTGHPSALSPTSPARSEISVNGSVAGAQKSWSASPAYRGHDLGTPASYAGGNTERHAPEPSDSMFSAPHQLGDALNTAPPAPVIPDEEGLRMWLINELRYSLHADGYDALAVANQIISKFRPYLRSQPVRPVLLDEARTKAIATCQCYDCKKLRGEYVD